MNFFNSNRIRRVVALLLAVSIVCTLTACRESPVLKKKIYVANGPVDQNNQSHENDEDNDIKDENLADFIKDDVEKERDYNYDKPVKGDDENGVANDTEHNDGTNQNNAPADTESKPEDKNQNSNADDVGTNEEEQINPTPDESQIRQIVDATGTLVDVPKDVKTVAGVGDVALYIEMLGGKNRLVASSENFKNNRFSRTVFGNSEIDNVNALWSDNGQSVISNDNFEKLTNELKPDVCFVVSGSKVFSNEQLQRLKENEIYVVTLPKLNTSENLKMTVNLIADVLGDKSSEDGQKNAPQMASRYINWYEDLLSDVMDKDRAFGGPNQIDFDHDYYSTRTQKFNTSLSLTGYYTLYISEWDSGASYEVSGAGVVEFTGNGMAIAPSGYSTTPLSFYMGIGGAVNSAALGVDRLKLRNWYISPLTPMSRAVIVNENIGVWERDPNEGMTNKGGGIGTDTFKNVIVAKSSIKSAIEADGLWTNYGPVSDGVTSGYGLLDSSNNIMNTNVRGDYGILVNPQGVGKWTTASPEAPLESVWINSIYYGDYTTDVLKNKITEFYTTFYGYNPSSIINDILAGE